MTQEEIKELAKERDDARAIVWMLVRYISRLSGGKEDNHTVALTMDVLDEFNPATACLQWGNEPENGHLVIRSWDMGESKPIEEPIKEPGYATPNP